MYEDDDGGSPGMFDLGGNTGAPGMMNMGTSRGSNVSGKIAEAKNIKKRIRQMRCLMASCGCCSISGCFWFIVIAAAILLLFNLGAIVGAAIDAIREATPLLEGARNMVSDGLCYISQNC